jgi:two-component system, OmpR family, heavy metal sensor histidine kinase CusS
VTHSFPLRSFRLRLALLSSLLAGLALAAFGMGAWWLVREVRIERIDHEIRAHAERETGRNRSPAEWQRIEARLATGLGVHDGRDLLLLVQHSGGGVIYRSAHWPGSLSAAQLPWPASPPPRASDAARPPPRSIAMAWDLEGRPWRFGLADAGQIRVAIAVDSRIIDPEMAGVRNAFALALPPALVLIGLGAWLFSARALRQLEKLTQASLRVTAEGLDQRIAVAGEDQEFVALIEVFNGMLARLQRSFQQAHRFSADAAHELKTPLAILQGQLERAIQTAEQGSAMQVELSSILDEVRRLSTISRKLLLLSQADAGKLKIHREPYPLSLALEELIEDVRMLAPHLQISGEIQPGWVIQADGSLLRQVLHNLISNAIKYNVEQGWIRISMGVSRHGVEIIIANASAAIPVDARERIFERFYRVDAAHSRNVEGVGLGLSVSREIARAHGGDISLSPESGGQVQFVLRLPVPEMGRVLDVKNAALKNEQEKKQAT